MVSKPPKAANQAKSFTHKLIIKCNTKRKNTVNFLLRFDLPSILDKFWERFVTLLKIMMISMPFWFPILFLFISECAWK